MPDDWYKTIRIAPGCHAIGEPRYDQQNWSYLIAGRDTALLFDTGSFMADITPVVRRLTDRPVIALPSHMHYDHLGNVHRFDTVHLPDLPVLRACEVAGHVTPTEPLFLGSHEDRQAPRVPVARWLPIGGDIDLGDLTLTLLHTPGHSPDSVSLWWPERGLLFAADFLYHGPLYAQVPGASLPDYLGTTDALLALLPTDATVLGAHGDADEPGTATPPRLDRPTLTALRRTLIDTIAAPPHLASGTLDMPVTPQVALRVGPDALSEVGKAV